MQLEISGTDGTKPWNIFEYLLIVLIRRHWKIWKCYASPSPSKGILISLPHKSSPRAPSRSSSKPKLIQEPFMDKPVAGNGKGIRKPSDTPRWCQLYLYQKIHCLSLTTWCQLDINLSPPSPAHPFLAFRVAGARSASLPLGSGTTAQSLDRLWSSCMLNKWLLIVITLHRLYK